MISERLHTFPIFKSDFNKEFFVGDIVDYWAGMRWHKRYRVTGKRCCHFGECSPEVCRDYKYSIAAIDRTHVVAWLSPDSFRTSVNPHTD